MKFDRRAFLSAVFLPFLPKPKPSYKFVYKQVILDRLKPKFRFKINYVPKTEPYPKRIGKTFTFARHTNPTAP